MSVLTISKRQNLKKSTERLKSKKAYIEYIKNDFFGRRLNAFSGDVLEIGYGKGDNFKYYTKDVNLTAIDIKTNGKDFVETNPNIEIIQNKIEDCGFKKRSFNNVVGSFVLCSIRDKKSFFVELERVLDDNGSVIFLEHAKSKKTFIRFLQHIFSICFSLCSVKCRPNNEPLKNIPENLFKVVDKKIFNEKLEPYILFELQKTKAISD